MRSNLALAYPHAILDEVDYWLKRGYKTAVVQDALEWLWQRKLVQTDDDETPPIYPRASIIFRSQKGDAAAGNSGPLKAVTGESN